MFKYLKWQTLLSISSLFLLLSCNSNSSKEPKEPTPKLKIYSYIEIVSTEDLLGRPTIEEKEPKEIQEVSDSLAYIQAYQKFCISNKAMLRAKEDMGSLAIPMKAIEFRLLNDEGVDIVPNLKFKTKELKEKEIRDKVSEVSKKSENKPTVEKQQVEVDSLKVNQLISKFNVKKDEFSNEDLCWYIPKSAPKYINENGIYCYFQTKNGEASNLRLQVQYTASEWLFFKSVKFSIDDKAYSFYPSKVETDHGNGGIWEWFDSSLTDSDRELIYALANAKIAKVKFEGRQYSKVKDISAKQIVAIKQTLELYNALGGNF